MKISLLINMRMPTIIGIFIFISRENFMLSKPEHGQKIYNLGDWVHMIVFPTYFIRETIFVIFCVLSSTSIPFGKGSTVKVQSEFSPKGGEFLPFTVDILFPKRTNQ